MREIKFRAWDGSVMFEPRVLVEGIPLNYWFAEITPPRGPQILMQFTGLKDSKGKEIYEGDILVYRKFITEFSYKDKAGHYRSKKRTKPKEELHYWQVFWNERHGWMIRRVEATNSLWKAIENHEVIGNIYENPDLLSV